jgi:hypothetical protein
VGGPEQSHAAAPERGLTDLHKKKCIWLKFGAGRVEGRAPVWGSEFTSKRRRTSGGIQQKPL